MSARRGVCRLSDGCRQTSASTAQFRDQACSFIREQSRVHSTHVSNSPLTSRPKDGQNMRLEFVRYGVALLFSVPLFAAPPPSVISSRYAAHHPIFISASAMVAADGTTAAVVPEDWRPGLQQL